MKSPSTPQLPSSMTQWSTRGLAECLGVSASTVKYHARQMFRSHQGRWEFDREQAQRVANHIHQFGQRATLCKTSGADGSISDSSISDSSTLPGSAPSGSNSSSKRVPEPVQEVDFEKIERQLDGY